MEKSLSLYHIFYVVANTGNISTAARELYISQPAISKSVSRLESILNTTLFIRNSRGVTLTSEGALLYEHIHTAFDSIWRGEQELLRTQKLGVGHIRIGVSTTLCKYILLPYLESFINKHPHVKITIVNQPSAQTIQLIEQQHIDIALIPKVKMTKTTDFIPLTDIHDVFVCSPKYLENFHLREGNDADIFEKGNIMVLDNKNLTRHYVDAYLHDNHFILDHVLEVSTMDLLVELAKIGLGVGCCIKECVKEELETKKLVELPLEKPIPQRSLGFVVSNSTPMTPSTESFLSFISDMATKDFL